MQAVEVPVEARIELGGNLLPSASAAGLRVTQQLGLPSQCVLTLDVELIEAGQAPAVQPGDELRVEVGDWGEPLFEGEVSGVEHVFAADLSRVVRIRGYDRLHRLRRRQQLRVIDSGSLGDLVRELLDPCDLKFDGPDGPTLPAVFQHRRTDLQLLRDVTARAGLFPVVLDDTLTLVDLTGYGEPIDVVWGDGLHSAQIDTDGDRQLEAVEVFGWQADPAAAENRSAHSPRLPPGAAEGRSTSGERTRVLLDEVGDADAADRLAQAHLDVAASVATCARLVVAGDPRLSPGRRVAVKGLGQDLDGVVTVSRTCHEIDERGYTVQLSTAAPDVPEDPGDTLVTLGIVTAVDDPEGRGRVQVRLTALGDLVTLWVPQVMPGAGPGRGGFVSADVDDRVVVLLPREDPVQALVIGGLYGPEVVSDPGVENGRSGRYTIQTDHGQRLVLDGHGRRLRIESEGGGLLEISDQAVRISATTDVILEAPGHSMTLRAARVDFQEAP